MINKKYYHFEDDLRNYPDAWCYVVWSKRGPGKTYSSLWWAYQQHIKFIYMKRTDRDVDNITMAQTVTVKKTTTKRTTKRVIRRRRVPKRAKKK